MQQIRLGLLPHVQRKNIEAVALESGEAPRTLQRLIESIKWGDVVKALLACAWGGAFIRTKEPEVDKEGIIAARATLQAEQLAAVGINITQDEAFYIEPKTEELERGVVAA